MKIDRLILKSFRGIQDLELPLDGQLTVLAGINGSGKSAVLDALAILLSWVVARIRHSGGSGRSILERDIHNQTTFTMIRAEAHAPEITSWQQSRAPGSFSWQMVKTRKGHSRAPAASLLGIISRVANQIRSNITENQERWNVPVFAYYPVNRAVLDIPLRIRKSHKFSLLEAWDGSLTGAANFRVFFEWFRNREDLENENRKYVDALLRPDDWVFPDTQLEAVRQALKTFLPEFSQLTVRRNPPLRMTVLKHGREIRMDQLSDGEKCLIALIGDLARRLSIANPTKQNPLEGDGVVLIDEIDLHLHPGWQRMVLPRLTETFPNCQFIVSTHSPQVIGEVAAEQMRLLTQDDRDRISYVIPKQSKGLTTNEVLDELMRPPSATETWTRNTEVESRIAHVFRLIDEERITEAKEEISELEDQLHGDVPDLVRAKSLLTMLGIDEDG
jgi:predicted ATP-binding protein involved in virulence